MSSAQRKAIIAQDAERRQARRALAAQVDQARTALAPSHLVALWRAQQVRRMERLGDSVSKGVRTHRGLLAGIAAAVVAGAAAVPLIGWLITRNRMASGDVATSVAQDSMERDAA